MSTLDSPLRLPGHTVRNRACMAAVTSSEIAGVIDDQVRAVCRALAADFPGVRRHAGSGDLGMQFLAFNTNCRDDAHGGTPARCARFLLAAQGADAVMFGRAFMANPDLSARLQLQRPLNVVGDDSVYGGDHRGSTDEAFATDEADPAKFLGPRNLEP